MKKTISKKNKAKEKSIFQSAGEVIGTVGHEIAAGKDKLLEAAKAVAQTFSSEKKDVVKKTKTKAKKTGKKIVAKKAALKKKITKVTSKGGTTLRKAIKRAPKKAAKSIRKK